MSNNSSDNWNVVVSHFKGLQLPPWNGDMAELDRQELLHSPDKYAKALCEIQESGLDSLKVHNAISVMQAYYLASQNIPPRNQKSAQWLEALKADLDKYRLEYGAHTPLETDTALFTLEQSLNKDIAWANSGKPGNRFPKRSIIRIRQLSIVSYLLSNNAFSFKDALCILLELQDSFDFGEKENFEQLKTNILREKNRLEKLIQSTQQT